MKTTTAPRLATLGAAALALAAPAFASAADLVVRVEGVRSADGDIRVAVHRRADGVDFPDSAGIVKAAMRPAAEAGDLVFAGLAPGEYAIAAFHDEDRDGDLDTNLLGMPTEGYGFSNEARGAFGPP
ncbi:MAG: DUF2141 domain-containing protein, partial [Alphaproteobacteria bacterium]|nr:DUF2141 domain-containing protein [Alphaproteobacteria bacterium]